MTARDPAEEVLRARERFYGVQILRGIAALLVLFSHVSLFWMVRVSGSPALEINGAAGVDIFFAISGFVMYLTGMQVVRRGTPPGSSWDFLSRRALRVIPPYYLLTVAKLILLWLLPALAIGAHITPWNTVASFLFLPAYNSQHGVFPVITAGWTLNYEMLFYALLTLLLCWRLPLLKNAAWVLISLAVVSFFLPERWGALTRLASPLELEFLAGMLLGRFTAQIRNLPRWCGVLLFFASLTFIVLPHWYFNAENTNLRVLLWGVPGAMLVLSMIALEEKVRFSAWRPLLLLGDASYSLYLTHGFTVPVLALFFSKHQRLGHMTVPVYYVVTIAIAIAVAVCFHLYLEMPLYRRLTSRRLAWSARSLEGSRQ